MKKIKILFFSLVILLLAGCGGGGSSASNPSNEKKPQPPTPTPELIRNIIIETVGTSTTQKISTFSLTTTFNLTIENSARFSTIYIDQKSKINNLVVAGYANRVFLFNGTTVRRLEVVSSVPSGINDLFLYKNVRIRDCALNDTNVYIGYHALGTRLDNRINLLIRDLRRCSGKRGREHAYLQSGNYDIYDPRTDYDDLYYFPIFPDR